MSDWLMSDDSGGDGGYLGMDDPAMPDSAPAPPTAPAGSQEPTMGGDWLGGSESSAASAGSDDWLGAAPADGQSAGSAPVMDSQGDWLGDSQHAGAASAPAMPATPMHDPYASATTATPIAQSPHGDLTVTSPQLAQVQPSRGSLGGARSELSDLVLDVEVQTEVGLGNAALTVEEFLEMGRGSVVELDTPIDAPIELKVRGKLIARGQLVSINGHYGMRIIEMMNEEN